MVDPELTCGRVRSVTDFLDLHVGPYFYKTTSLAAPRETE
jgi:hypothetical protein